MIKVNKTQVNPLKHDSADKRVERTHGESLCHASIVHMGCRSMLYSGVARGFACVESGVALHAYNYVNTTPPHTQVQSQNLTLYYSLSFVYVVRGCACAVLQINVQATPGRANVELILGASSVCIINSFVTRNSFVFVYVTHVVFQTISFSRITNL